MWQRNSLFFSSFQVIAAQTVNSRIKFNIFDDREILVETELLGHITHAPTDLLSLCHTIESQDSSFSQGWSEKTTERFNQGGFPRPIRSQKSENFSFLDPQANSVDGS